MKKVVLIFSFAILGFAANYERDIVQMIEFKNSQKIINYEVEAKIIIQEAKIKNLENEIETMKKSINELEKSYTKALQALTLNRTVISPVKAKMVLDDLMSVSKDFWVLEK